MCNFEHFLFYEIFCSSNLKFQFSLGRFKTWIQNAIKTKHPRNQKLINSVFYDHLAMVFTTCTFELKNVSPLLYSVMFELLRYHLEM